MELGTLNELRDHGKLSWSEGASAWAADPGEVVSALAHAGFQEYKRETTRSGDRTPRGGVWQGLDSRTGAVASAVWVVRDDAAPLVFIDIDGEPLRGDAR